VKTQQARKDLSDAVVICELWRLAVAQQMLVVANREYPMRNLVYSHYILRDNTFVGNSEGRRPCGAARPRFHIKADIEIMGLVAVDLGHGPPARYYESTCDNELSGSIKCRRFLD
jgi:hypothetical protein